MDQKGKKIFINASSLVDLKAELFRKQEEFKQQKLTNASNFVKPTPTVKKPTIWSKANAGVLHRAQNDLTEKTEERDVLDQSKSALEAKARLYEKMTKGDVLPEEDGSILYLVDFQQKALEVISDERRERLKAEELERNRREEEEEKRMLSETIAAPQNPDEEWVEYVDSFGRSRKCLKKDLQHMTDADRKLPQKTGLSSTKVDGGGLDLMSADMRREQQRQEWEKETEEAMNGPVGPTHYANVQHSEVRDHGVGYFQFAKDEETRQQQLDELNKLRNQTQVERDKRQRIKDKRDALLQARLAKVRQRKTVQDAADVVDLDPMSMLENQKDGDVADIGPQIPASLDSSSVKEAEPVLRDESFRKAAPVREWDRGKKPAIHDQRTWLESRREERPSQFAPPTAVYESSAKASRYFVAAASLPKVASSGVVHVERPDKNHSTNLTADGVEQWVGAAIRSVRTEQQIGIPKKIVTTDVIHQESTRDELSTIPLPPQQYESVGNEKASDLVAACNQASVHYGNSWQPYQNMLNCGNNYISLSQGNVASSEYAHFAGSTMNNIQSTEQYSNMGASWTYGQIMPPNNYSTINSETGPEYQREAEQEFQHREEGFQNVHYNQRECFPDITILPESNQVLQDTSSMSASGSWSVENCDNSGISPENLLSSGAIIKAPLPAHFSSAPLKPQPKKAKYEAIHLHELPPSLPAPPTSDYVPQYPSQEEILGPSRRRDQPRVISEGAAIKSWYRQFDNKSSRAVSSNPLGSHVGGIDDSTKPNAKVTTAELSLLKPKNIPFASRYIQNERTTEKSAMELATAEYDPSKPPPPVTSSS